jgi:MYXO-CTERM domain-containing protein
MRPSRLRILSVALAAAVTVLANGGIASAETDTFGLGTGRDGPLLVTSAAGQVVNTYAPVTAAVAVGATTVTVGARSGAAANFTPGQLVMLLQTRGGFAAPLVSGSGATVTLSAATKTGRYELARVATAAAGSVTFTHATVNAFDANATQLISVPEYTTVTINAAGRLVPQAWDGATGAGGVLAFFAKGAVANAGIIDVSERGFGGGVRISTPTAAGCAAEDGVPTGGGAGAGGAHKGEGLDPTGYSTTATYAGATARHFGRGNIGNAGGGGSCFNAGGGGGGHGGAGGAGGDTNGDADARRAVGGRGGAVVAYVPTANLSLGGGGGAGEDDDGVGGIGGSGGGVLWMRADSLSGAGTINADGRAGANAGVPGNPIFADGGGGGGAGGGVFAWFRTTAVCGGVTARGGRGGNAQPVVPGRNYGPGGGGAGGRVQIASSGGVCPAVVTAGVAGTTSSGVFGANAGAAGASAAVAALAATACDVATGKCGGCVTNAFCPADKPTCVTAAGPTQWTCVGSTTPGAPYGQLPNGAQGCTAGPRPTQGTAPGCVNGICDTIDGRCGYLNGTVCEASSQCRSNICHTDGRCGLPDGTVCTTDASCRSASCKGGVCGPTASDGGIDGSANDGGSSGSSGGRIDDPDGDGAGVDPGTSLEGGGISCSTSRASSSSLLVLLGLAGIAGIAARRSSRRRR